MRRNSSHLTVIAGFAVAVILLVAGGLLTWGSAYVHNTVQGQLSAQQIFFPPKAAFANPKVGTRDHPEHDSQRLAVRRGADADRAAGRGLR